VPEAELFEGDPAEPLLEGDTVALGVSGDEFGLAEDLAGLNSIPTP
jgi:hypothetical protein